MDSSLGTPTRCAFLAHGSPMNALEQNRYTGAWRAFGQGGPKPRAILVISAHWFVPYTAVTAMAQPRTIHDFFGFPPELFAVQYPAPGDPRLAEEVADIVSTARVGLDGDSWGLDHGTWSLLVHAFPSADVPVVQLSIHAGREFDFYVLLGRELATLRESGVMIIGSGNVVHNLRAIDWSRPDAGFDWCERFDDAARTILTERPEDAPKLREHPDFRRAVPTDEHFVPVLYLAGIAAAAGRPLEPFAQGYAFGSLSMSCYGLACAPIVAESAGPSAPLPDPHVVPTDETNT